SRKKVFHEQRPPPPVDRQVVPGPPQGNTPGEAEQQGEAARREGPRARHGVRGPGRCRRRRRRVGHELQRPGYHYQDGDSHGVGHRAAGLPLRRGSSARGGAPRPGGRRRAGRGWRQKPRRSDDAHGGRSDRSARSGDTEAEGAARDEEQREHPAPVRESREFVEPGHLVQGGGAAETRKERGFAQDKSMYLHQQEVRGDTEAEKQTHRRRADKEEQERGLRRIQRASDVG
ncbi:hypothetical protein ACJX0J_038009, partial [Zea mays]